MQPPPAPPPRTPTPPALPSPCQNSNATLLPPHRTTMIITVNLKCQRTSHRRLHVAMAKLRKHVCWSTFDSAFLEFVCKICMHELKCTTLKAMSFSAHYP